MKKLWVTGLVAAFAVGVTAMPSGSAAPPNETLRDYIIVLRDDVDDPGKVADEHANAHSARIKFVYGAALKGYSATLSPGRLNALSHDPRVESIEEDGIVTTTATQASPPSWGLDRIDERARDASSSYTYANTGAGVKVYVIDTGIRTSHTDFGGRAIWGTDRVDGTNQDCNGHGTHVAGTVGGAAHGVAKGATLVAVRVLDCGGSGTWSAVIAGVDWVTADHQAGQPAVANMSLSGSANSAVDTAVRNSIADGVTYAVAAGNGNYVGIAQDACKYSPARLAEAITVSATSSTDAKASWANYGKCVDLFAPGVGITSTWSTSDSAINTISGTSMASPHVAGVAALYLQSSPGASPSAVASSLAANATAGVVTSAKTSNPKLLYTNY